MRPEKRDTKEYKLVVADAPNRDPISHAKEIATALLGREKYSVDGETRDNWWTIDSPTSITGKLITNGIRTYAYNRGVKSELGLSEVKLNEKRQIRSIGSHAITLDSLKKRDEALIAEVRAELAESRAALVEAITSSDETALAHPESD